MTHTEQLEKYRENKEISLCKLPPGITGRICKVKLDPSSIQRLDELGLTVSNLVTKLAGKTNGVFKINNTTIALSHTATSMIYVTVI